MTWASKLSSTPSQRQKTKRVRARMIELSEGRWVVLYPNRAMVGTATMQIVLEGGHREKGRRRFERSKRVLLLEVMERCKDLLWGEESK